jgi:flagellar assembly protein FliH
MTPNQESPKLSAGTDAAAELWAPPPVHGRTFGTQGERAERLDRNQRNALDAIFAKARAEGYAAGKAQFDAQVAQLQERIGRLDAMLQLQARPLAELDAVVEKQLTTLALTVARHLVRRELRIDPTQVVAIIRGTVALLPAAARDVRVHLHPEDAALVRERLVEPQAERAWTIVEDPIMARGGCRVTTDTAQIDARVESRLGAAISAVLGSERVDSRDPQSPGPSQP